MAEIRTNFFLNTNYLSVDRISIVRKLSEVEILMVDLFKMKLGSSNKDHQFV